MNNPNTNNIPVLSLAYLGDSVYETMVRDFLVRRLNARPDALHEEQLKMSNAAFQSDAAQAIAAFLTEGELAVLKAGRNAKTSHRPKGGTVAQYHAATGLEALFGRLWLEGNKERLDELFDIIQSTIRTKRNES